MTNNKEPENISDLFELWESKTLLIVDDETITHDYIKNIVLFSNIKILHAYNGKEAIELFGKNPQISIIIMDISMPIMDGYEATRIIKTKKPKMPIIAQTAYALSTDKVKSIQGGFDCYLTKPIEKKILIETLAKYMK